LTFDEGKLLFFHVFFLFEEGQNISGLLLKHGGKMIDSMLRNGSLFGVVLDTEHFADDGLFEDFD
jgi:hypothetical protein